MNLPSDDFMLLSVVNTALRDKYRSFSELCEEEELDGAEISARLSALGYKYDESTNSFR